MADVGTEDAGAEFEVFAEESGKLSRFARLFGFEDFPSEGLHLTFGTESVMTDLCGHLGGHRRI